MRDFMISALHQFSFRVIKSISISWTERVVPMKERKVQKVIWRGNMREGEHLEDLGVRR
jgi:hypothetical protein